MSLLIHKPASAALPECLIRAACGPQSNSYGLIGIAQDGELLLQRRHVVDVDELLETIRELRDAEYVLHLRQAEQEGSSAANVYPFKVSDDLYLMHNGALPLEARVLAKSSTWHLVHDVLRPLANGWRGLSAHPVSPVFRTLLEAGLAPDNKAVLLDHPRRRVVVINHRYGFEFQRLWLSDARCLDPDLIPVTPTPLPTCYYGVADARFLH